MFAQVPTSADGLRFAGWLALLMWLALPAAGQIRRPSPPDSAVYRAASAIAWPDALAGRRMASGEVYRPGDWIVAHPTLPIGTRLLMTSVRGGRAAVVTVADHASLLESGSMLVSRAAADLLEIREEEPSPVRVRRLARGEEAGAGPWSPGGRSDRADRENPSAWSVQLGSFSDRRAAERYSDLLDGARVERVRVGRRSVYRVYFGRFRDRAEAEAWRDRLGGWGINGFVKSLDD